MWGWLLAPSVAWWETLLVVALAPFALFGVLWSSERLGERIGLLDAEVSLLDMLHYLMTPYSRWAWRAFYEEALFRLPLAFLTASGPFWTQAPQWWPTAVTVSCVLFGAAHAETLRLIPLRVLGHGLAGFMFVVFFLKVGGNSGHPFVALAATTLFHATHNFLTVRLEIWRWRRLHAPRAPFPRRPRD